MSWENNKFYITTALLAVTLGLTIINTLMLAGVFPIASQSTSSVQDTSGSFALPTGTPDGYGNELDVRFDDVSTETPEQTEQVIQRMSSKERIDLSPEQKQRYINILYEKDGGISCEYCCEARSVITAEGKSGCGCAHAAAMRGLTKYLLTEHPDMTDQEILTEVSKWKTRFFPEQTKTKVDALQEEGVEPTPITLSVNKYRGISSDSGGWAGDC